jgi:hypothetical protein
VLAGERVVVAAFSLIGVCHRVSTVVINEVRITGGTGDQPGRHAGLYAFDAGAGARRARYGYERRRRWFGLRFSELDFGLIHLDCHLSGLRWLR